MRRVHAPRRAGVPTLERAHERRSMYQPQNGSSNQSGVGCIAFVMIVALVAGVVLWFNRDELPEVPSLPAPAGPPPVGAAAIVEKAAAIAGATGMCTDPGPEICVASAFREGAQVQGGGASDHAWNDENRAARDIAVRNIDVLKGPPSPLLDSAAVAIGAYFGRSYALGAVIDADNFDWAGYRVQIIWRTPKYRGHMGHIHIGACRGCPI